MFSRKKLGPTNGAAAVCPPRTATSSIQAAIDMMEESLEHKKQAMSAAQRLTKKLTDTLPPAVHRKSRIA